MLKIVRSAELLSDRGDVLHRGMGERGEAEAEAELIEAGFDLRDGGVDVDAEFGQHVGRAAAAGDAAIAVLGDGDAGGCGDDRRGRADVEELGAAAAGAAGVEELGVAATDGGHVLTESGGRAGDLVDRFAFGGERSEEEADSRVGPLAVHDRIHGVGRLVHREAFAAGDSAEDGGVIVWHRWKIKSSTTETDEVGYALCYAHGHFPRELVLWRRDLAGKSLCHPPGAGAGIWPVVIGCWQL